MRRLVLCMPLLFFIVLLTPLAAQSPRDQLTQMVEQLKKNPADAALREKIIKLGQEIKPAPAVPEEAERHMAYGTAAFTGAKSLADYKESANEFEQATFAAPWYGDAYFNLGVAQDKAENYEAALRSLHLARLALPESKDIKTLIYQIEYRNKKAHSPEAEVERQRAKDEAFMRSLDGAVFSRSAPCDFEKCIEEWQFRVRGSDIETAYRVASGTTQMRVTVGKWTVRGRCPIVGRRFKEAVGGPASCTTGSDYEIALDGQSVKLPSDPSFLMQRH